MPQTQLPYIGFCEFLKLNKIVTGTETKLYPEGAERIGDIIEVLKQDLVKP